MSSKLLPMLLCAVVTTASVPPASAAGPPLPLVVPNTAQEAARTQLAIQQAQARANLAAAQARLQAQLDATQARLEGQVAAQQRAQLDAARRPIAGPGGVTALPLPVGVPMRQPPGIGMQLTELTPQLGRYFGTDHGVLVVHAPGHGALNLQDGDVILSIGGRTPRSGSQAIRILASYDPGQKVRLLVLRDRHKINITATMPGPPAAP